MMMKTRKRKVGKKMRKGMKIKIKMRMRKTVKKVKTAKTRKISMKMLMKTIEQMKKTQRLK